MAQGRCNCGSIKVSIPALPEQSGICYCTNCRRAGSSVGSLFYVLDKTTVTIDDPGQNLKSYEDNDTASGNSMTRQFCASCGCPVTSLAGQAPTKVFLKAGLFEHIPPPAMKAFEKAEPQWMKVVGPDEKYL